MNLEKYIAEIKSKENKVFGPALNYIKNRKELVSEIEEKTSFLDSVYNSVSLGQRFYHVFFESYQIEKCKYCDSPKEFSKYKRVSAEIDKKDSNYHNHCDSIECVIKDFEDKGFSGKGFGGLIGKASKDLSLRKQLLEKTNFLDIHYEGISDSQRFYHVFFGKYEVEKCSCGSPKKFSPRDKFSKEGKARDTNYNRTCGNIECISKINVDNGKKTILEKYGVDNIWKIPGFREKYESSNIEKYGSPYITGSKHFKEKTKEKIEKDWGGLHPSKHKSVQDKRAETNLEKYGVDCILKDREKMKKGMVEKYGVEFNMQIESIHEKTMKTMGRYYDYILPSGDVIKLQGYEKFGMDYLLKTFSEKDIITNQSEIASILGQIKYGNNQKYYPDIYVKSIHKIFEVKSPYTYDLHKEKNIDKKNACENKGIEFEFLIFDSAGNLLSN